MTAEQLSRAIEPFYTTKPEGRGTGLGLSMVYGFTKQSGGHFRLYSEVGQGTTARLYIPRSLEKPVITETVPLAAPMAAGETVLVVEDDPAVRAAVAQTLNDLGYGVLEAGTTQTALDVLRGDGTIDLLFTDVIMPGTPTPRDLADAARELHPAIAIVFTSGYTRNTMMLNGRIDPDVTLVSKPWHATELASKLRGALEMARQHAAGAAPDAQPARTPSPMPRDCRVLLVEDDALVRMTTLAVLTDLGCTVSEAATGAEALELLRDTVDVLLVDLNLPDMGGEQVVAEARDRHPGLRVIVASGAAVETAVREGVIHLPKPYQTTDLQSALRRALTS